MGTEVFEVVWLAGALEFPTRMPNGVYSVRAQAEAALARARAALSVERGLTTWRPFPATTPGVLAVWVGLSAGDWIEGELQLRAVPVLDARGSEADGG